jgi:integrase
MARTIGKLSTLALNRAKERGYYGDGGGLYLRIGPTGAKSWVYRFKEAGRVREMGLGPLHTISLADARQKALDCRKTRIEGKDPLAEKRAQRARQRLDAATAMTFKDCAAAYIAAHRAGWRNPKHAAQWPATLGTYVHPIIGGLPIQAIDTALVLKTIEPIWTTKPETASRVRGRIESVLDWAAARGYRQGENPARWRGHLDHLLPNKAKVRRVEHRAALPYAEIGPFMAELRRQDGIGALALEFAILTTARTSEVIGAGWDEFNLSERLWTIPAGRMKAGKEHRVPLSDAAMAIIEQMATIRQNTLVFPGARANRLLSHMTMLNALGRMGRSDVTPHGFRSTFRDWAAERTSFPAEVADMALAHVVADKVEAAYRRGDLFEKRRQIMDAWARFCEMPAGGAVVAIRSKRAMDSRRAAS